MVRVVQRNRGSVSFDGDVLFGGGATGIAVSYNDDDLMAMGADDDAASAWDTADANANLLKTNLPTGGAVNVPVYLVGIGILTVDLVMLNGQTQPFAGVVDADRDSYLGLSYSADDVAVIQMKLAAGTERLHTIPNVASDTITLIAAVQTLTNKTLTTTGAVAATQNLTAQNTNDAASVITAVFQGDRATPADNDAAYISLRLSDSVGNQDEQARLTWKATTVADGATQDGDLVLSALVNNVLTDMLTLDGSVPQIVAAKPINVTDATDSTSGGTGAIYTAGGLGITKALYVGATATLVGLQTNTIATDAASVQVMILQGDRATPTDGDEAYITLKLSDSAGNQDESARITWKSTTVLDGATQDSDLILSSVFNGVLTAMVTLDGSLDVVAIAVALQLASGTVSAPSLSFTSDVNSGAYSIGADNIGLALGGVKVWDYAATVTGAYYASASAVGYEISGYKTRGTVAVPTVITTGDDLVCIAGYGYDGTNYIKAAEILLDSAGTIAATRVAGQIVFRTGTDAAPTVLTDRVIIDQAGVMFLNDTSNANMTLGLTLNQGAADNEILSFKSSDVAHGATDLAETDTYGGIYKSDPAAGGLSLRGYSSGVGGANYAAIYLLGTVAVNLDTTKTSSGLAATNITMAQTSGVALANVVANGNLIAIRTRAGGAYLTRVIIDTAGDIHTSGTFVAGFGSDGVVAATGTGLYAPDITTGGAGNIDGADLIIAAGIGTGTGDVGTIIFSLPIVAGAGDIIQTRITALTIDMVASATAPTFFFATGSILSFNAGDVTLTHATNLLTLGGGSLSVDTGFDVAIGGAIPATITNTLTIYNGTAPVAGTVDSVIFYSSDIAAGHTEPSFFCEGTSVLATGQGDSASSVRVKMRINGTEVTLLAI